MLVVVRQYLKVAAVTFTAVLGMSGTVQGADFIYPQGVYNG